MAAAIDQINRTLFEEQLIEEMKKHPNLYTKRSQLGFHEYSTIEQTWNLVSKTLSSDTKTCKKIWRNLRDSYVRQLKKINFCHDSGSDSSQYTKWKHFHKMSFLKNVITHRPINGLDSKSNLDQSSFVNYPLSMVENGSNKNSANSTGKDDYETNSYSSDGATSEKLFKLENNTEEENSFISNSFNGLDENNRINSNLNSHSNNTNGNTELNSFLSKSAIIPLNTTPNTPNNNQTIANLSSTLRTLVNEDHFGQHVARSLENLTARRRSTAKLKIQEILYEYENEDAKDPIHGMPNIFLNSSFPKL